MFTSSCMHCTNRALDSVKSGLNVQKEGIVLISVKLSCCKPSGIVPENILTNIFRSPPQYECVCEYTTICVCVRTLF